MKRIFLVSMAVMLWASLAFANEQIEVVVHDLDYVRANGIGAPNDCGVGAMAAIVATHGQDIPALLQGGVFTGAIPEHGTGYTNLHRYFMTHSGFNGSRVPETTLGNYLQTYYESRGVQVEIVRRNITSQSQYAEMVSEINAGRPFIIGSERANHYWLIIGYKDIPAGTRTLIASWGHNPFIRDLSWTWLLANAPYYVWYVRPIGATPPPDELPQDQSWWPEVSQWMNEHGWQMIEVQ